LVINWLINKKHSIIFQINIFFIFIFFVINILIVVQFLIDNKANKLIQEKRYFDGFKIVFDSKKRGRTDENEINSLLQALDLKISNIDLSLLTDFKKEETNENNPIQIYLYNGEKYIRINPPKFFDKPREFYPQFKDELKFMPSPNFSMDFEHKFMPPPPPNFEHSFMEFENIILIDGANEKEFKYFWVLVLFIIDILLIWFLIFLRKKLRPLLLLKENMIKLSTGNFLISTKTDGKDEISQVANEFDYAMKQLRQLKESRNLFLRNIMHELKTPITKGKLVTDMYDDCERKHILIRVFQRLEYLLSEFAKIEELTSGKISLEKNEYYAIDLIEQAFDILLIDNNKIDIEDNADLILNVDFELFSIALKNLIDNSITYNTNGHPQIFIEKDSIKIVNKGEKLEKDIEEYYKPFNHEYEDSTNGLGLGLYISNNIIKIHNYKLEYEYINNYHNFVIKLN
jgi:two-component system, OmpR family, sensor kinase